MRRAYRGFRLVWRADVVDAVAIDAFRGTAAAGGEQLAMDAVRVMRELVGGKRVVVGGHEVRVRMAVAAELGDALAGDADFEAAARVHGNVLVGFVGVAA